MDLDKSKFELKELNKTLSKNEIHKLKSKYFLEKVMFNIHKNKFLDIIKYNKNIQKRLNLTINDYIECCEKFSSIEIEILPTKNKYGKFININKKDELYYHIYFNNNREEIKRTYIKEEDKVSKINIRVSYQITSFYDLFNYCRCIESINFKKFYRNNIINMSYMFHGCSSLKELNISNFNTSNVTNMSYMFGECSSLKELNLSNFNTSNVTDICFMFQGCSSLEELDLSNFNTNKVISMNCMFFGCSSLKELNLSSFNTDNIKYKSCLFIGCSDKFIKKIKLLLKI